MFKGGHHRFAFPWIPNRWMTVAARDSCVSILTNIKFRTPARAEDDEGGGLESRIAAVNTALF